MWPLMMNVCFRVVVKHDKELLVQARRSFFSMQNLTNNAHKPFAQTISVSNFSKSFVEE